MHLNANTSTRSFRELAFDVRAALQAIGELRPLDNESSLSDVVVYIPWADGSVDIAPPFQILSMLSEHYVDGERSYLYGRLNIGGVRVLPSTLDVGDHYYSNSLSLYVEDGPLSAKLHLVSERNVDEGVGISDSRIHLLEADSVIIPPDADIRTLNTDVAASDLCRVQALRVPNKLVFRTGVVTDLDLHLVRANSSMQYPAERVDASNIVDLAGISASIKLNGFKLSGPMRFSKTASIPLQNLVTSNATTVTVDVPVKITGGYAYYSTIPITAPQDISTPFDMYSPINLVMLYPFMQIIGYSELRDIHIRLDVPRTFDSGRVVQVNNATGSDIRVCNAWMFTANGDVGVVQAIHYMSIPAYTTIDYLVRFDDGGSGLRVYMLPMTEIV